MAGANITSARPKYRSELGIALEILSLLASNGLHGVSVSAISRVANVSYNSTNSICGKLKTGGLVRSAKTGRNHRYTITESGREFLGRLRRFVDEVRSVDIRC